MTPYSAPGILEIPPELKPEPLESLLELCCRVFDQPKHEVISKSRKRELVDVRAAFCLLAYNVEEAFIAGKPSPSIIGGYLRVNHASVIYHNRAGFNRLGHPSFRDWSQKVKRIRGRVFVEE